MEKTDILSLSLSELEDELIKLDEKKFRAKQIFQWLHVKRVFDFEKINYEKKETVAGVDTNARSNRYYH